MKNQRRIIDFHDFTRFLGKSGCQLHPPPKLCAGIFHALDGAAEVQHLRATFEGLDVNGDGTLTYEEMVQAMGEHKVSGESARLFQYADTEHMLTLAVIVSAVRFWLATFPSTPPPLL